MLFVDVRGMSSSIALIPERLVFDAGKTPFTLVWVLNGTQCSESRTLQARTLPGAPGLTTSKKLLGGSWPY